MHVLPQADELGLCFGAPCVQPLNKAAIIDIHLISSCVQPRLQFFPPTAARIGWLLFAMSTSASDTMRFTSPPPPAVFLSRSGFEGSDRCDRDWLDGVEVGWNRCTRPTEMVRLKRRGLGAGTACEPLTWVRIFQYGALTDSNPPWFGSYYL